MFDIGFWELVAIAIIALIVLGPERLPKFAHDLGHYVGKIRRFIQSTKDELEKELDLSETNDLDKDIHHLDKLMKEAPDKLMVDNENNIPEK